MTPPKTSRHKYKLAQCANFFVWRLKLQQEDNATGQLAKQTALASFQALEDYGHLAEACLLIGILILY